MQCARSVGSEGLPLSLAGLKRLGCEALKVYRRTSRCPAVSGHAVQTLAFTAMSSTCSIVSASEALDLALSASQALLQQAFPYA